MRLKIEICERESWRSVSEDAHRAVFGREKSAERDRFDYVLLAVLDEKPFGYIMVREVDSAEVYWQFGGAFQWARNSIRIGSILDALISKQISLGSKVIGFRVEQDNFPMLKLALSRKFLICGIRTHGQKILVEWTREISNGDVAQLSEHAQSATSG
jgi:hypothetical protein